MEKSLARKEEDLKNLQLKAERTADRLNELRTKIDKLKNSIWQEHYAKDV